jgi:hypothetical protein
MSKTSGLNVRWLTFFEERDAAALGECQGRYCHLQSVAFLKGYDASWYPCLHQHTFVEDVPSMLINALLTECHALTWVALESSFNTARDGLLNPP